MFKRSTSSNHLGVIVDVLELRTNQLSKLAVMAINGRAEGMLNGPIESSCGVKRNIRRDSAICLVGTVEKSVDLTRTCHYEVRAHPYAAERRLQSVNKPMTKQKFLGPKRNLTLNFSKYHQVFVLTVEVDECGALFESTNVSRAIGVSSLPVLRNVTALSWFADLSNKEAC